MTYTTQCPYCGSGRKVSSNGLYKCRKCGKLFTVDFFEIKVSRPHRLPNSCGISLFNWLVADMGLKSPGLKEVIPLFKLDASRIGMKGTMPWNFARGIQKAGIRVSHFYSSLLVPSKKVNVARLAASLDEADRLAVAYKIPNDDWHWVGMRAIDGILHVADSLLESDSTDISPLAEGYPRIVFRISRIAEERFAK
ncbi:MAG: hypothetical protein IKO40_00215 [Kiritimatiellae bacterium]|nr:hypothetical protein [Kiritimatiellia bacterium]